MSDFIHIRVYMTFEWPVKKTTGMQTSIQKICEQYYRHKILCKLHIRVKLNK